MSTGAASGEPPANWSRDSRAGLERLAEGDPRALDELFATHAPALLAFAVVETIDIRAQLIKADELITGDRYIFIRDAYLQQREYFVTGGEVEDSFSDYDEEFDWDE